MDQQFREIALHERGGAEKRWLRLQFCVPGLTFPARWALLLRCRSISPSAWRFMSSLRTNLTANIVKNDRDCGKFPIFSPPSLFLSWAKLGKAGLSWAPFWACSWVGHRMGAGPKVQTYHWSFTSAEEAITAHFLLNKRKPRKVTAEIRSFSTAFGESDFSESCAKHPPWMHICIRIGLLFNRSSSICSKNPFLSKWIRNDEFWGPPPLPAKFISRSL